MNTFTKASKLYRGVGIALAGLLVVGVASVAFADHDSFDGEPQTSVTICHANGNGTFIQESPSISSNGGNLNLAGHENNNGVHTADIIPPFHYEVTSGGGPNATTTIESYPGKNWTNIVPGTDVTGEVFWNNGGCNGAVISGTLTLSKIVDGDEGAAPATDWTLSASGATPISGVTGSVAVTDAEVDLGDYDLSESGPTTNYTASIWNCGNATMVDTDTVTVGVEPITCTITNTYTAPVNPVPGCTDPEANNHDPEATVDDESCTYDEPEPIFCEGNLLVNGGFEEDEVTNGSMWQLFTSIPGWVVDWMNLPSNEIPKLELQENGVSLGGGATGTAAEGDQYLELDSDRPDTNANTKVWQDITTDENGTYELSYQFSPRPKTLSPDNIVEVYWNGLLVDTVTGDNGTNNTVWSPEGVTGLTATGTTGTLEFRAVGTSNELGGFIDSVCLIETEIPVENCSLDLFSDDQDWVVDAGVFATSTWVHSNWDANIPGATWIWKTFEVEDPSATTTYTFRKKFNWTGGSVTNGDFLIASDNSYEVKLNGGTVASDSTINNFSVADSYDFSGGIQNGLNTLEVTVTNWKWPTQDPHVNPAGLLYHLALEGVGESCGEIVPEDDQTSDVTICKQDDAQNYLPDWTVMLLGDFVEQIAVYPDGNDYDSSNLVLGSYVVKANGEYVYRPGTLGAEYSDAAYSKRHPSDAVYGGPFVPWVRENDFPVPHTGWLGIMMNGCVHRLG